MKPHSMEEKISYRLFLMGFLGLLFTAALCIFVFHRAFTAQAWDDLEKESDLIRAGYDLTSEPQQLSFFVTGDLRITLISPDGDVIFESATDQPSNPNTKTISHKACQNGYHSKCERQSSIPVCLLECFKHHDMICLLLHLQKFFRAKQHNTRNQQNRNGNQISGRHLVDLFHSCSSSKNSAAHQTCEIDQCMKSHYKPDIS